ncbi:MAG TPA: bifunctional rhamnulose-1-phosphate aldolase/short-chain dehydrogenase [Steroidobacteraceae bacterium]
MSKVLGVAHETSAALPFNIPYGRWSDSDAAVRNDAELLLYRSNLLGADLTITNFGGGNTSAKLEGTDILTRQTVQVLWVKGSGGDLGSMQLDGFSTLYLERLLQLRALYEGLEREDAMVAFLPHCTFGLNARAASIDTPLHAMLPFPHVDHVHPDAIIALAASSSGESAVREIWRGAVGWLPWQRPGFDLGLRLQNYVIEHPGLRGIVLAGHGLIAWDQTSKACYENTIQLVADAARYLNERLSRRPAFGGVRLAPLPTDERLRIAAQIMPKLRGLLSSAYPKIGHLSADAETLEFVCSNDLPRLAALGTSCPDHFLRTKIWPLTLDETRITEDAYLKKSLDDYRANYAAYYQRFATVTDPPMRDPNPVIILVPGLGRMAFAPDKTTARLAGEFYGNAINVMRGAEAIGRYVGLDEREAFRIEYWALEEAKLRRMPKAKSLAGRIALVTGGAGGIGAATAQRLLAEGACVMLLDRDAEALGEAYKILQSKAGPDLIRAELCDVTDENQVSSAFASCACDFGGLDILVANAGIASSAPLEETTVDLWRKNYNVLAEGYFLAARSAFPLMKKQHGGSIIFIGSKNGIAAAVDASAYASAKAAALHLARCIALEGAPFGIRVNTVNPDAVIKGSRIWDGEWRRERAGAHGIDSGAELEAHYRNRSMLKVDVLPSDIADAVHFFASDMSTKSTGNMLNVDAGNAQAFTR